MAKNELTQINFTKTSVEISVFFFRKLKHFKNPILLLGLTLTL